LALSPDARLFTTIHVQTPHRLTRAEALKLIETAVAEQTPLVITNGHLLMAVAP
jgi:hypothetical protein